MRSAAGWPFGCHGMRSYHPWKYDNMSSRGLMSFPPQIKFNGNFTLLLSELLLSDCYKLLKMPSTRDLHMKDDLIWQCSNLYNKNPCMWELGLYIETGPWGHLNIKMLSYQYRDSHVKDKTVSPTVLSLTWESPYLGKRFFILSRGSLYWDRALVLDRIKHVPMLGSSIRTFCRHTIWVSSLQFYKKNEP